MSEFFKSKQKFGLALSAVFLAITLIIGTVAVVNRDGGAVAAIAPAEDETAAGQPLDESPPEQADGEEDEAMIAFNTPAEMRGTFLVPGVDFLTEGRTSEETIRADIDSAIEKAMDLTINAVIITTLYDDQVIYNTADAPEFNSNFDILGYIVDRAREKEFYTYAIFDASLYESTASVAGLLAVGAGSSNKLAANLREFAASYQLDGILLDGYQNTSESASYASYLSLGGGIGFDNFLRQSPAAVVKTASRTIRDASPATQVGLLADAVWENQSANSDGSATEATYTALSGGNADTKGFVEKGYVDFVAVKAYTTTESQSVPFIEVVTWWADVTRRNDIPLYVVHATDKLYGSETGWGTGDQLIQQLSALADIGGVRGSIFNNLQKVSTDTGSGSVADTVKQVLEGEKEPEQVLTQLEMTKPAETTFTTSDPQTTFTGASDPAEPVTINGEKIKTDSSGYFTIQKSLDAGLNTFTIEHKGKKVTYSITRKIQVLKDASPMGSITTDGGMSITITATAYQDADVYATIGGATIALDPISQAEDEQDRDGFFLTFTGEYTAPAATASAQSVGQITVYAEYDGQKDSIAAASVSVNKKAQLEDGVAVRVTADQALTYPPDTLNNVPDSRYFPLPAGAMDYAVGDEIVYKKDDKTYTYYVLASGLRVESKDITPISDDYPADNVVSGMTVTSDDGFTYVTLKTAQKVSYTVEYTSSAIKFTLQNTKSVPGGLELSKNPIFSSAGWSGTTLSLNYAKANTFWGYKGYYDTNGNLVLRFNNPPSSLSGTRVAIDPGHGGGDIGASGFLSDYPEAVINALIANALAEELTSRGATVNLMNNAGIQGEQRKQAAENWNADLFVSVHCNSAPNISAVGTEVYYFQGFSKTLASNASSAVSSGLSTTNRGAKASFYHVTLSSQMPSVLVECGFLTNQAEYEKLIKSKYQKQIAAGIADALSATIKAKSTGISGSGSETVGSAAEAGDAQTGDTTDTGNTGTETLEGIDIRSTASINAGKTTTLLVSHYPEDAKAPEGLKWSSSNTSIATVDQNGKVTGVKQGSASITVTTSDGKIGAVCELTVKAADATQVKVKGIELDVNDLVLAKTESYQLRATITPEDADNQNITWRSDRSSVATVSATGKVTGVKDGEAQIIATTEDGRYRATCNVVVEGTASSGGSAGVDRTDSGEKLGSASYIQTSEGYYMVSPSMTMRLEVYNEYWETIRGSDFAWSSDDTGIVTVDKYGYITGVKVGEAYVSASAKNHETQEWLIEVSRDKVKVTGIRLDESSIELEKGVSQILRATLSPTNATNRNVTWTSSNAKIASVDSSGRVTGLNPGTVTITVRSSENSKATATCAVEVVRTGTSSTTTQNVYLMYDGMDIWGDQYFTKGEKGTLEYEIAPSDAKPLMTWESKSPHIVKIDQKGNFECLATGSATITLTPSDNKGARVTCRIIVE